jgi:UDP-N-acetylmuramate: L-alanyl-gamma-D-glutamyl-meso-diaminopimelate ligase
LPLTPSANAHIGTDPLFIVEGDEYPSSNWDNTSKFLHYHPHHVLLTALAHDHVNVFPTHEDYLAPFGELLSEIDEEGLIVACLDDETIRAHVADMTDHDIITYGTSDLAMWHASDISYGDITSFDLIHDGTKVATYATTLLGKHNIENIIGVLALLLETETITVEQSIQAVRSFRGIVRRLDKKSEKTSVAIYEGFGSSLDKARSAIDAIKLHYPLHKLCIIFEPHTFSWRNRAALHWYDTVFKEADTVFVYKPPTSGAASHDQLTLDEILTRLTEAKVKVEGFTTPQEGNDMVMNVVDEQTVVLVLSSGGMDGLIPLVVSSLEKSFPLSH